METMQSNQVRCRRTAVVCTVWILVATMLSTAHAFSSASRMDLHKNSPHNKLGRRTASDLGRPFTMTRLRYTDGDEDRGSVAESISNGNWWRGVFAATADPAASGTISGGSTSATPLTTTATANSRAQWQQTEQEKVDAYLEFLDRRYRRLHSGEAMVQRSINSGGPNAAPEDNARMLSSSTTASSMQKFPVLTWLLKGNPDPEKVVLSVPKQQDALYVLGVAGLASQEFLQKHHLRVSSTQLRADAEAAASAAAAAAPQKRNENVNFVDGQVIVDAEEPDTTSTILIKRVLLPLIRGLYVLQRRKNLMIQAAQRPLRRAAASALAQVQRPLVKIKEPRAVLDRFLELGGGKQTVMGTLAVALAVAYTMMLLIRPLLQATVADP